MPLMLLCRWKGWPFQGFPLLSIHPWRALLFDAKALKEHHGDVDAPVPRGVDGRAIGQNTADENG